MRVDLLEEKKWFINYVKKISKELNINPTIDIVEGKFGGEASGNNVWISIEPTTTRIEIKWLLCHELRHVFQAKFPLNRLYREKDRDRLISILAQHEGWSTTKLSEEALGKVLKKYHDILPEEVDANIYAYHKTRYNYLGD